ncbi:MAG: glycosyltransferase family 39 protein [Pseudomonadota bacterium]
MSPSVRLPAPLAWRLLLLAALAMPFLGLAGFPLFDLDEGAFTASTTEMFLRGDFLSTWLHGAPRTDKPILSYWLQAASVRLLGFDELGFRLPSALAAGLWILLTYAFAARVAGKETGALAAALVASALGTLVIGKAATADALLNLFLAAAGYAAWLWLDTREARWRTLAWAAMGLGFMTKGPVAVLIPGGTLALYCLLARDWRALRGFLIHPPSWLLFLAIAVPWFVVLTLREGSDFVLGFFLKHNLGRFSDPMEGHGGKPFYYLPVLLVSLLPFTGLLITLGARLRAVWALPWARFGLIWFALVFLLFSASGTKLPHYLYYGYAGLVPVLAWAAGQARRAWPVLLLAALQFALLLALPYALHAHADEVNEAYRAAMAELDARFTAAYRLYFAAGLLLALAALALRRLSLGLRIGYLGLYAGVGICLLLLPTVGWMLQEPVRQAGLAARRLDAPLVMQGMNQPSFQTYAQRLVERRVPRPGDVVLIPTRKLGELPPHTPVGVFRDLSLVRMQ